jgi:hypothetical protein
MVRIKIKAEKNVIKRKFLAVLGIATDWSRSALMAQFGKVYKVACLTSFSS